MIKKRFDLKKNIFQSLIFKVIAMALGVILVPIVLHYLGKEKYGIWVTLTVVFNWFGFFDFGIGNGLRNMLSEANAKGNFKLAKELVSTSYVLISLIFFFLFAIIVIFSPFANWYKIFNIGSSFNENFNLLILFLAGGFSFSFILRLLAPIFFANQHAARKYMADTISTVISFILIVTVTKIAKDSLSVLLIIYAFSPLVVYGLASIYFFNKDYKTIKPSIKSINFKLSRSIVGMGTQFLIIQLSALFLQSSIFFLINFFL
jgi:O-antigen/teichoic acid export membrane protein